MMSRGMRLPLKSARKPVSIGCESRSLTGTMSPAAAVSGMPIIVILILHAGRRCNNYIDRGGHEASVAHPRDGVNALRGAQPDPRFSLRAPRGRREVEPGDIG